VLEGGFSWDEKRSARLERVPPFAFAVPDVAV